ncbi:hypothetical protein FH039_05250 [Thermococcus indicus]|uniref:Uncharacterized protein n=1 Tax=Thermococcus indicus TaxID=2586643 RepID=A0A4Y5SPX0_9EURY|nr:hypothetical protein [Thermococcus indicus]QDA32349.1 hypothetical protein FH039_05250 [Thermococcus indicus]
MKTKSWEVEISHPWESLQVILSEPEKTLPFFPYFEDIQGDRVRFKVPRFIFNFGYEFKLTVGFQEHRAVYTFTGDRGILTITFEVVGGRLRVSASWAGFGEALMGKPLENFARGIAEAIKDFCSARASCPVARITGKEGVVEHITSETAPALIKRVSWELEGKDFLLEGRAEDGTRLSAEVRGGKLVRLVVYESGRRSVIESDVPVLELDGEVFRGLPLEKRFEIKVREL